MAHLTDLIDWGPWDKRTNARIEIGDYVKYYNKQEYFKVIGFEHNYKGDRILRLDNGDTIHPCYVMIDIRTQRKRKLKKIFSND